MKECEILKKQIGMVMIMTPLLFSLFGCGKNETKTSSEASSNNPSSSSSSTRVKHDSEHNVGYQLEAPSSGEEIAVIKTNMGDIKLRFFEEAAPKAVENFKTHAKNGYYDGVIFHRVINDFMIQTGDPKGDGTGGASIWNRAFEDEFSDKLFNIRGAVAMANSGKNTNGSQFFINQAKSDSITDWNIMESNLSQYVDFSKVTDEIKKLYSENGGNIHLDGALSKSQKGHTVFAQVFEGLDVVDKIASVSVDKSNKPTTDVTIDKIEIVTF